MSGVLLPLQGLCVLEHAQGVAAAYAGRLLATMGAQTIMAEPVEGCRLRREPPFLAGGAVSALFASLALGKQSVVCAPGEPGFDALLARADIFIDDTPMAARAGGPLDPDRIRTAHPRLIYVSVLPFGAAGPKAGWKGEEVTTSHAGGEGNLLPNGLTLEMFPGRAPLKMYGNFAQLQAGVAAAMAALVAALSASALGGQFIDIAEQDVSVALSAMAVQRLGDGVLEHRTTRSFRWGGVFPCADGHIELVTAEERQWQGLVQLVGSPAWMHDKELSDPAGRGRRGPEVNREIRAWAAGRPAAELVAAGQTAGVPVAKYRAPGEIVGGGHEQMRGLFAPASIPGAGTLPVLVAPMQMNGAAIPSPGDPPRLGADQHLLAEVVR